MPIIENTSRVPMLFFFNTCKSCSFLTLMPILKSWLSVRHFRDLRQIEASLMISYTKLSVYYYYYYYWWEKKHQIYVSTVQYKSTPQPAHDHSARVVRVKLTFFHELLFPFFHVFQRFLQAIHFTACNLQFSHQVADFLSVFLTWERILQCHHLPTSSLTSWSSRC